MKKSLLFLFICLLPLLSNAQGMQKDNNYIALYPDRLQFTLFTKYSLTNARINHNDRYFDYRSQRLSPGFRLQFDKWGIGFNLPINLIRSAAPSSDAFAMQVQAFPLSMVVNAGFSRIKGAFNEIETTNTSPPTSLKVSNLYFNPVYALNHQRFSLNTLYNLDQRQLQSQGSPLIGLQMNYSRLKNQDAKPESDDPTFTKYHFRQHGIELGYAYTYILNEHYFISGLLKGLIAQTGLSFKEGDRKFKESRLRLTPLQSLLFTLGYQDERSCVALQFHFSNQYLASQTLDIKSNGMYIRLLAAYRLYQPGLKQQAIDTVRSWRFN